MRRAAANRDLRTATCGRVVHVPQLKLLQLKLQLQYCSCIFVFRTSIFSSLYSCFFTNPFYRSRNSGYSVHKLMNAWHAMAAGVISMNARLWANQPISEPEPENRGAVEQLTGRKWSNS